ncbi:AAA family ATPase [Glycomyces sp. MUSA5-2]|uniref:AAA family ATPase n=1 Tax=Glycomyces sp. MUSA5-2 TaxID=2053002 RepID=UPI0030087D3B
MSPSGATVSVLDTWLRGVEFLDAGDKVRASDCFEYVLDYAPSNADAWLGLHASGERRTEALLGMLEHRQRMGLLQEAAGRPLESSFRLGRFVEHRIARAYHAWLAYVAALIDDGELELAAEQLDRAEEQEHALEDRARLLKARCCFERDDWTATLKAAEGIEAPRLRDEARFYVAVSLVNLGVPHEALDVLDTVPGALEDPEYVAHVMFVRGAALESLGQTADAAQAYQRAFRLAPDNERFAERARAVGAAKRVELDFDEEADRPADDAGRRTALLEDAAAQLDAMIGLEPVKSQIEALKAQFRMASLRRERGLPGGARPHHFVFTGPPGTGKTTVARIMGEILAGLGLLEHGRVVETQRADLVAGFLGQTAIKTRKRIEKAVGGVLFIDEAYSLAGKGYAGDQDAFGDEALQEILTAAENRRDELVIVLAGYTGEIRELLDANPGLRSRFSTVVDFPTYSAEELAAIAASVLGAGGETLTAEAERALLVSFTRAASSGRVDELGNGRFARELSRKAAAQRDLRLLRGYGDSGTPSAAEMTTIEAVDVSSAYADFTG